MDSKGYRRSMWHCTCVCGEHRIVRDVNLASGNTKSCGCRSKYGGLALTRAYFIWYHMLRRCQNPADKHYYLYGARGITVCERWQSLDVFFADMGEPEEDMSLERIDNDSGYSPENCRWTTMTEQAKNKRNTKLTWELVYTIRTSHDSAMAMAERYQMSLSMVYYVINNDFWVDDNYVPPRKWSTRGADRRLGQYVGPARATYTLEIHQTLRQELQQLGTQP